jgi:D-glycero-alpha-D-manno-heptose-7-phosphate kinase
MLRLPMGEYDIARYAYDIERIDLGLAGGRQDQYAATFGGVNYMEFYDHNKVIVNPLRIKPQYLDELENNLVLYYTDTTRASADIITEQQRNVTERKSASVDAMHQLKEQSRMMKEALLQGRLNEIGEILDFGFRQKRLMAANISNDRIEKIYGAALAAGALGGKISGAGGGGFMMFYCPGTTRYAVSTALTAFGGEVRPFAFSPGGLSFYRDGMR